MLCLSCDHAAAGPASRTRTRWRRAELLARPCPEQERVDAGDGHPVAVHVDVAHSYEDRIDDASQSVYARTPMTLLCGFRGIFRRGASRAGTVGQIIRPSSSIVPVWWRLAVAGRGSCSRPSSHVCTTSREKESGARHDTL